MATSTNNRLKKKDQSPEVVELSEHQVQPFLGSMEALNRASERVVVAQTIVREMEEAFKRTCEVLGFNPMRFNKFDPKTRCVILTPEKQK